MLLKDQDCAMPKSEPILQDSTVGFAESYEGVEQDFL